MGIFQLYFKIGFHHIVNVNSLDHILFVICLTAVYSFKQWKQLFVLITAFTIGHSLSLLLAILKIYSIKSSYIEFYIPATIFITSFSNLFIKKDGVGVKTHWFKYITALFFGLIHGYGFSNYLQSLLGVQKSIVTPILSFNLGIEVGQILIVTSILIMSYMFINWLRVARHDWVYVFSGAGLGVSLTLMISRFPW